MVKGRIIRARAVRVPLRLRAPRGSTMVSMPTGTSARSSGGVPVLYRPPMILGSPQVGETLYAINYAFTNAPDDFAFQWNRDGVAIELATNASYTVVTADAGREIDYVVVASSGEQVSAPATSDGVTVEGVPVDPNPIIPASQTVAFERKTLARHGGHACGYLGTGYLGLSGAAAAKFHFDDINQLVPTGTSLLVTFGSATSLVAGTLAGTITEYSDAAKTIPTGVTGAVDVVVNAGDNYTVTWKPVGSANADTTGTYQLQTALKLATTIGQQITVRDGAIINPAGASMRLRSSFSASVVTARRNAFTGENHTIIRPETFGAVTIRRIQLDQGGPGLRQVDMIRIQGFKFELTTTQVPALDNGTFMLSASVQGTANIDVWDNEFVSTQGSLYGLDMASAINGPSSSDRWRVYRNHVHHVGKGIYLANPAAKRDPVTLAAVATVEADHSDSTLIYHEVRENIVHDVSYDEIVISNCTGAHVTDNVLYNKVTAVRPYSTTYTSPYNTGNQPHGDGFQIDYAATVFGSVDGPIITGNTFARGLGRDTMPFYTSPPYAPIDPMGYVPSVNSPYLDSQGIFISNGGTDKPLIRPAGGGLGYPCVIMGPVVRNNCFMRVMVNAITIERAHNPIIENNTVLGEKSVTAVNNPASAGKIGLADYTGTAGRVRNNISTTVDLVPLAGSGASLTSTANNVDLDWNAVSGAAAHTSVFLAPAYGVNNITKTHWRAHFAAKPGGAADLGGGVYAGAFKADGTDTPVPA